MGETNEGVIGVTVWTDDLERLLGFYRDTLGLRLRSRKGDWANFEWGSLRLNLGLHGGVKGRANDPYRIMITFGVSGIHDEYHRLKGQGSGVHTCARAGALGRLGSHLPGPRREHIADDAEAGAF